MILGIGTDITSVDRIAVVFNRFPKKMAAKILAVSELNKYHQFKTDSQRITYLAKRFAAKEAFAKALGLGIGKCGLRNIQVLNQESGKPFVATSINLNNHFGLPNTERISVEVSLSDEKNYTIAFVVIWLQTAHR
jgi:holo-[acyl-carrier protein] synthase